MASCDFGKVLAFANLVQAWKKAARGKRASYGAAAFEDGLADHLLQLHDELHSGEYRPGGYTHFTIHEPKRRRISAAPFRDRVVHHAQCNVIEPVFEAQFIADSYANRIGKGTHRAVARLQQFARRYRYVLRLDIVKHFPAIDHAILLEMLAPQIDDPATLDLARVILASGEGVLDQEYTPPFFPGDDLLATRAADRQSDLPVLVELLPASFRPFRPQGTRLPRVSALRRRLRAVRQRQTNPVGMESRRARATRCAAT
ncbi:MAG: Retron-type reverse transcriptase [Candidatus Accumulibacter sp.]|uniref:Retron-type reverse transcriptase n=1 Tax=Candidatus Accumulibacter proximus TaxID=2954385 RepID=A0A935Q4I9_9PROT|nr:Retron-type reverse transcriptase [Candidatus Accumulibacter proximus]